MRQQNADIGWNRLMLQCYTLMLCCYSVNIHIYTCFQWCYIMVFCYMSIPNSKEMITIIFNTNMEMCECVFINFLQHFILNFTNSACIQLFDVNRSETGVKNTFVFRGSHKKNSHNQNAARFAMRRSPNFCFEYWMAKLVAGGVAPSCWKQVCFRTTQHLFNSKKSFQHLFILRGINANSVSMFVRGGGDDVVLWSGAPHCNLFQIQSDFVICWFGLSANQ